MTRIAMVCLVTMTLAAGCSTHFPYGVSWDRHNFVSEYHLPKHVALVDTATGKTVWEKDVPVGQQLVIDLEHDNDWTAGQSPASPAKSMKWDILPLDSVFDTLKNEQKLNGHPVMLKVTIQQKTAAAEPVPTAADVKKPEDQAPMKSENRK